MQMDNSYLLELFVKIYLEQMQFNEHCNSVYIPRIKWNISMEFSLLLGLPRPSATMIYLGIALIKTWYFKAKQNKVF